MTNEIEKVDCIDSLIFGLNHTGGWRKKLAIKFPSDPRNSRASDCLKTLAVDAPQLTDADWRRLQPYAGWASESWRESISVAARQVGFTRKIKDFSSFVDHLLEVLAQSSAAA
jgi:hypothetical protein